VAGPEGGYTLTREPDAITLLDVIEAAEGPLEGRRCAVSGAACTGSCVMHEHWSRARQALISELRGTTFASLAGANGADGVDGAHDADR
jgi:Rrf2 family protein